MYIREIEINNFRIYKGKNRISIAPKNGKNITIVSGQNGFGKTTFLMSLVWCLYGKNMGNVDSIYKKEIDDQGNYTKYVAGCMNRKAAEEGEKNFSVKICFSEVNVQGIPCEVEVERSYNILSGTPEKIKVSLHGHPQELVEDLSQDNQKGEEIFIRDFILPIAIAKFFFFDAEKITSLAEINQQEQRKELSTAYAEVLGIKKYEDLKNNLEDKLDEYRKKSATIADKKRLNEIEADIKNAEIEQADNENRTQETNALIVQKKHDSDEISLKLVKAGDKMSLTELEALRQQKAKLENERQEQQNRLKDIFDSVPFALAGEELANVSGQVKDERLLHEQKFKQENVQEKITKIRQDIESEKREIDFVIDVKVSDFYTTQIERLVKKYFFSETKEIDQTLTPLHSFSENQENSLNELISSIKNDFHVKFERLHTAHAATKSQIESIGRKIREAEKSAEDSHIRNLRDKRESLENEISQLQQEIGALGKQNDDIRENLKKLRQEQSTIRKHIDDSAEYSDKEQKTKKLIGELEQFIKRFKEQKKESLQTKMMDALELLLHKKDFVSRVDVDILTSEDIDINLYDKNDNIINKSGLSMGERQLYASALLSSLVSESEIDFPVFIDSPMQKFDKTHAENIIKHFYPNVAKQVVIYPLLHKELTEAEYKLLVENISKTFLINNLTANHSEFLETEPNSLFETYNEISNANHH